MFCRKCGNEIKEDSQYCFICGAKVEGDGTATMLETEEKSDSDSKNKIYKFIVLMIVILVVGCLGAYITLDQMGIFDKNKDNGNVNPTPNELTATGSFNSMLTIPIPVDWEGKVIIQEEDDYISYLSKANEEIGYGGYLFSLGLYNKDNYSIEELETGPSWCMVGDVTYKGTTYYLIAFFPSDVQFYFEEGTTNELAEEYAGMESDILGILENIKPLEGVVYVPNPEELNW